MNRREFLRVVFGLLALPQISGCGEGVRNETIKHRGINVPPFSEANLHNGLERLLTAFESKGLKVSESLLPAVPEPELRRKCTWFPGELSEEIVALYGWRGGQVNDAWASEFPFWFRDNSFCSIDRAEREYESMMYFYGRYKPNRLMLKYAFPIASFNGGWYVLPTKGHNFNATLKRPIISVHEGVEVYFYSIEKMVETCVEWVEHENYSSDGLYPASLEMEFWRKHNLGIFT